MKNRRYFPGPLSTRRVAVSCAARARRASCWCRSCGLQIAVVDGTTRDRRASDEGPGNEARSSHEQ